VSRGRGAAARLRGLAALAVLLILVVGLPVLLYRLGGSPIPRHLASWPHIWHTLRSRDNGALFLGAVRDVSWLAWAAFTVAVLAEAQAAVRGAAAPRLRLGGLQSAAGHLVALAVLAFSGPSTLLLAAQPVAAVASVAPAHPAPGPEITTPDLVPAGPEPIPRQLPEHPAGHEPAASDPQVMSMGFYQLVTVRPGDCLWTIAQRYLGDGDRYPEIVQLNLGHEMGDGQRFTDPSVILPGWILQLPAASVQHEHSQHGGQHSHGPHPAAEPRFRRPHPAASHHARGAAVPPVRVPTASPTAAAAGVPAYPGGSAAPDAGHASAGAPAASGRTGSSAISDAERVPPVAVFAAGMLAGGAVVTLSRMRHRQRQSRRLGRRIALPASAPVITAERRLHAEPDLQPATLLRAALGHLGARLAEAGHPIPEIIGIQVSPDGMDVLLAGPASEPPPPPFTVPGGHQGKVWRLPLADGGVAPYLQTGPGDLLPGLVTVGVTESGYLLLDLEYLRVTTVDGPAELADRVLTTAAAELATSELAGWYELILVGFPEVAAAGDRATRCDSVDEALDRLAAKAVALRRRLADADAADIRQHRLDAPDDEDWALTLLVSRVPPAPGQVALLLDLCADPAGMAALVPGCAAPDGHLAPASIELAADPDQPGGIQARMWPSGLRAWPQPLTDADYQALASMFATAADEQDVAADEPPYHEPAPLWPAPAEADLRVADYLESADPSLDDGDAAVIAERPAARYLDEAPKLALVRSEPLAPADAPAADALPAAEPARAAEPDAGPPDADGTAAAPPSLRIGVLGSFTINGAPAALQPAQSQLVLALALHGQAGLSNQQLCYLLGADPDHPRPSDSLRQLIVRTRRQLGRAADGREWIEHLGSGQYALHPAARFDWAEFDELASRGIQARDAGCLRGALALIRGQAFTGCYHWWLDPALTETVRAQIVDAAEMLADLELAAGDPAAAARAARTGLAGDVGAEQLWRALMRAEHAAGNLTGVREAWSRCLDAIAEIAADGQPHPRTAALYRELLAQADGRPARSRS
jgi:DNA-binding SARP family transcriptional activator